MPVPAGFLAHRRGDHVAVAVADCEPGPAIVAFLLPEAGSADAAPAERRDRIEVLAPIPLGHKVALANIPAGGDIVEYGERIGVARSDIVAGDHVHTQNLRSARWQLTD